MSSPGVAPLRNATVTPGELKTVPQLPFGLTSQMASAVWNELVNCISLLQLSTNAYHPIITNLTKERGNFHSSDILLEYLENVSFSLPNKSLSENTALSLTEVNL